MRSWRVQFSLFGAEAAQPQLTDLDGLVLAGGDWVIEPTGSARLSVLVTEDWRAQALCEELTVRGLEPDIAEAPGAMLAVRSEVSPQLASRATAWRRGASLRVPGDLSLSASGLRLWCIASGRRDEAGYLLGSAPRNADLHRVGGAQLSRLGVAGVEVVARPVPGWRIASLKRLRRFAELVGPAPAGGSENWPIT